MTTPHTDIRIETGTDIRITRDDRGKVAAITSTEEDGIRRTMTITEDGTITTYPPRSPA